ncbi:hypothetical protein [Oharaeibacter diazotrophicus]|uniref:Uncharacterized protein n=1 Tax=Oharaeibacter diazotrophicus TaxID=1920512 RepID=A0A4R6RCK0_9HYPH|nr:hypothetical protein [Oharaeibacter diazotrophicus]TDP83406.1 hypothetical protein EDD54_3368 [Oharaeibacter diazotrophicus]BBE72239.1 hypothetical protein OHA_1_01828 [Pleomorphomonas sp. SM30]GLS79007.1 hypothetical protein GCM10007904_43440 [Oharaeibacter diazotrophicus]
MVVRFLVLFAALLAFAIPAAAIGNDRLFKVTGYQEVPSGEMAPRALKLQNGKVLVLWIELDPALSKDLDPVYRVVGRIYDPSRTSFSVKRTYVGQRVRKGEVVSPAWDDNTSAAAVLADGRVVVCWLQAAELTISGGGYCTIVTAGGSFVREASFRDLGIAGAGRIFAVTRGTLNLFVLPGSSDIVLVHQGGCPAAKKATAVCISRFDAAMASKRYTQPIVDRDVIRSSRPYSAAALPDGRIALAYNWMPATDVFQRAVRVFDPTARTVSWERAVGRRENYATPFEIAATTKDIVVAYPASQAPFPIKRILVDKLSFAGASSGPLVKFDGKDSFPRSLTALADGAVLLASYYNLVTRITGTTIGNTVNYAGEVRNLLRPPSVVQIDDRLAIAVFDMSDGTGNYAVWARLLRLDL